MTRRTTPKLLLCAAGVAALLAFAEQGAAAYTPDAPGNNAPISQDPGDMYAAAFWLIREARILADKQSYNNALQKGREAERLLASIVRDHPSWKPNLIEAKRKQLAEKLSEYSSKAGRTSQITRHQPGLSAELPSADPPSQGLPEGDYRPVPLPNYATTDRNLYHALARAQEEVRRMAKAYTELNTRHEEIKRQLAAAQIDQQEYKKRYEQLAEQIAVERQAGNSVVESLTRRFAEMETKYHASENALKEARERADELQARMAQVQSSLQRVERERDSLKLENEKLRAIVELNSPEKTKALLDQNLTLAEQLKTAQEKIQQLEAEQTGASDENAVLARQLEETRAEAARLRDEISGIYDENMGYRKRISELTEQLNNMEAELNMRGDQPPVDPALAEENEMLRSIIDKQRRTLAMQEESRRLLIETYRALKGNDPEVMRIIKKMQDGESLELTAAEKKILEDVRNGATHSQSDTVRLNLAVETLADLAGKAFSKGRYISAEQLYLNLYDLMPDNVAGLVNLSTILLYTNKDEEALKYLMRATRLAPDTAICHYLTGVAHYRLEQLAEASKAFSRTVQLDPGNAEAFFYLANIESISGSFDRALKHFAAAVKIKSELADAHYNMARLYAETSRLPDAARAYDRAIHNGAEPDPEFERYLRHHPDVSKAPGADLVATIKPEAEAQALRRELPADEQPNEAQPLPALVAKQTSFESELTKITTPMQAVQTASPAGAGHETAAELLGETRIYTAKGVRTLRLKKQEPRRLRTRGEEEISLASPARK